MVAYQSARLLPSWENAAFRICVQVARVGAAASPRSVTSRLLERHVTERWCNESVRQINFELHGICRKPNLLFLIKTQHIGIYICYNIPCIFDFDALYCLCWTGYLVGH